MKVYENDAPIPLISDTHFGNKSFSKIIFRNMISFFEDQFFPWCLKNNVKNVFHLGDLVHNRNIIDLWINQQIKTRFFQWFEDHGINLHILVGNHDLYYKTSMEYNYLAENTKEFDHIIVYENQEKIKIGKYTFLMIPWVIDPSQFKFQHEADICCGHFETIGFKMTPQQYSDGGFNVNDFNDFKHVFSGHFHIKSHKKNVYYVGNQYPITWSDYDETKGFYILEDNFKVKYQENKVNGKFVKLFYKEIGGIQIIEAGGLKKKTLEEVTIKEAVDLAAKNYTRLYVRNVESQALFDSFHQSLVQVSRDNYKIEIVDTNEVIESFNVEDIESEIADEADTLTVVSSYLEGMTFEEDIDKKFLIDMFKSLYYESSEKVIDD